MSDCFVLYLLLTCMKKKTSGADKFTNNKYGIFEGKYAYQRGYALYYVWQSIGAPKASQKSTFTDYKDWVFYADAVAWAESRGIIKDNGDHKFRPDDAVTRVELAKFICYAYK